MLLTTLPTWKVQTDMHNLKSSARLLKTCTPKTIAESLRTSYICFIFHILYLLYISYICFRFPDISQSINRGSSQQGLFSNQQRIYFLIPHQDSSLVTSNSYNTFKVRHTSQSGYVECTTDLS